MQAQARRPHSRFPVSIQNNCFLHYHLAQRCNHHQGDHDSQSVPKKALDNRRHPHGRVDGEGGPGKVATNPRGISTAYRISPVLCSTSTGPRYEKRKHPCFPFFSQARNAEILTTFHNQPQHQKRH